MDILAVREAARFALDYCQENGPLVYEISTYRYHGHSMSDPGTSYRSRDEVQEVRQSRDPITGFRERIVGAGLVSQGEVRKLSSKSRRTLTPTPRRPGRTWRLGPSSCSGTCTRRTSRGRLRGSVLGINMNTRILRKPSIFNS